MIPIAEALRPLTRTNIAAGIIAGFTITQYSRAVRNLNPLLTPSRIVPNGIPAEHNHITDTVTSLLRDWHRDLTGTDATDTDLPEAYAEWAVCHAIRTAWRPVRCRYHGRDNICPTCQPELMAVVLVERDDRDEAWARHFDTAQAVTR